MMLIDLHAHYIPPQALRDAKPEEAWRPRLYRDARGKQMVEHGGVTIASARREFTDIDKILKEQEDAGVDVVALSPWSSLFNYDLPADECLRACRLQNEAIAERVRDHPRQLAGLGMVPLQDASLAAEEAEHIVHELHLHGIEIGTNVNGKYPCDESFMAFWQAVADLDTLVFIHPVSAIGGVLMKQYELWNLYGNPAETGLAAASLILGGVLERLPGLKILLAHGGGTLPYIIGRFDRGWQVRLAARSRLSRAPSTFLRQFYFDTIVHSAAALGYLIQTVGADRVVIGSDYPFDMGYMRPREIVDQLGLPKEQENAILGVNAARLLKIKESANDTKGR